MIPEYEAFLAGKAQHADMAGFDPVFMPSALMDFQAALTTWAVRMGRSAIFADCGLGKTFMELVWAENVHRRTNRPVMILCPLAVKARISEDDQISLEFMAETEDAA